ncbi:hypothetical protein CC86DRAFT_382919 [Ophiobolus disseminans]|uniref:Uncharacterized protein n=1 Tax=Ophiobolus disseminans TaxID=1469910 RepID=A0A6A6ZYK5_9PLEO|nr:hypothetical protein CC86DRAFT_382919 [Ophiobolus disseminans]
MASILAFGTSLRPALLTTASSYMVSSRTADVIPFESYCQPIGMLPAALRPTLYVDSCSTHDQRVWLGKTKRFDEIAISTIMKAIQPAPLQLSTASLEHAPAPKRLAHHKAFGAASPFLEFLSEIEHESDAISTGALSQSRFFERVYGRRLELSLTQRVETAREALAKDAGEEYKLGKRAVRHVERPGKRRLLPLLAVTKKDDDAMVGQGDGAEQE